MAENTGDLRFCCGTVQNRANEQKNGLKIRQPRALIIDCRIRVVWGRWVVGISGSAAPGPAISETQDRLGARKQLDCARQNGVWPIGLLGSSPLLTRPIS
jgi:hypothetical protein